MPVVMSYDYPSGSEGADYPSSDAKSGTPDAKELEEYQHFFQTTFGDLERVAAHGLKQAGGVYARAARRLVTPHQKAVDAVNAYLQSIFVGREVSEQIVAAIGETAADIRELRVLNPALVATSLFVHNYVLDPPEFDASELMRRLGKLGDYSGACGPNVKVADRYKGRAAMDPRRAGRLVEGLKHLPNQARGRLRLELRKGMDRIDAYAMYVHIFVIKQQDVSPIDLFRYLRWLERRASPKAKPAKPPSKPLPTPAEKDVLLDEIFAAYQDV